MAALGNRVQQADLDWPGPLFPFQQVGVERLVSQPNVLLADEMGLGKTIQAIAALRLLKARGSCRQLWWWRLLGWFCSGVANFATGRPN